MIILLRKYKQYKWDIGKKSTRTPQIFAPKMLLNTGDDSDGYTAAGADLDVDIEHAIESLLPRAWAQVIAAWHPVGVLTSPRQR
jgi:hypothetical protein